MPYQVLIFAGLGLLGLAAVVFWEHVVKWAHDSLFPWFESNLPEFAPYVREGFIHLNKAVMSIRKAAIAAWQKLRPHILKVVETFERKSNNKYVLRVTSYLRKKLTNEEFVKRETEHTVSMDDLPDDVQEAFLRGKKKQSFNVTEEQDRQMEELELELV